jgi:hypothetical protein
LKDRKKIYAIKAHDMEYKDISNLSPIELLEKAFQDEKEKSLETILLKT